MQVFGENIFSTPLVLYYCKCNKDYIWIDKFRFTIKYSKTTFGLVNFNWREVFRKGISNDFILKEFKTYQYLIKYSWNLWSKDLKSLKFKVVQINWGMMNLNLVKNLNWIVSKSTYLESLIWNYKKIVPGFQTQIKWYENRLNFKFIRFKCTVEGFVVWNLNSSKKQRKFNLKCK